MPTIVEDAALFAAILLCLYFGGWALVDLVKWRQRVRKEKEAFAPCPRCGKPVLAGSEEYHRQHCLGKPKELKTEQRWKGGPRE